MLNSIVLISLSLKQKSRYRQGR